MKKVNLIILISLLSMAGHILGQETILKITSASLNASYSRSV